ncbi:FG-GAP-like repeat-containing protein [Rhodopirellula sp. P2]|uniref:FG-GAP-like repeat-containing protein n=1 Tax=Rhodopirellula sp. P2 TaxID=2127060 RepID=UPI002367501E|nr:FG-GAP-like repeat-containing protein [Rhodopirellula sp. P2]WDQ14917.1 FG-GAP-like repeat-containing protein [Rhodopirellula sp. P2]
MDGPLVQSLRLPGPAFLVQPFQIGWNCFLCGVLLFAGCAPSVSKKTSMEDASDNDSSGQRTPVVEEGDTSGPLSVATEAFEHGDCDRAAELLTPLMIEHPEDQELLLLAARVEAKRGKWAKSLAIAESVAESNTKLQRPAIAVCVNAASKLNDPRRYEEMLRRWAEANPNQVEPYHRLWRLFMKHGRTFEAARVADRLVFRGQANLQQLQSLVFRGQSVPRLAKASGRNDRFLTETDFRPGHGRARHSFSNGEFQKARAELESALAPDSTTRPVNIASAKALLGRVLVELQDDAAFLEWYSTREPSWEIYDDYWFAIGSYHVDHGQHESAMHALLEALRRNSADLVTYQRIQRTLKALQRNEQSDAFEAKAAIIHESRQLVKQLDHRTPDSQLLKDIGNHLLDVGRPLESLRWTELSLPETAAIPLAQIKQQRRRLQGVSGLRQMMLEDAMVNLSPSQFELQPIASATPAREERFTWSTTPNSDLLVSVDDVATERGLNFQWYQAEQADLSSIALYESLGGGVGVIDYDADGRPDLYFAQGAGDPPKLHGTRSNQLFRNLGERFVSVQQQSGSEGRGYSQGICVGDVNQDGWPDLLIANIGSNRLLLNNGDGTFQDGTNRMHGQGNRFTSSMAIADLNGDAVPDLYEVNYIDLKDAFDPPEYDSQGRELLQGPLTHPPTADHWYRSDGQGHCFGREIPASVAKPGTGLGIVVTEMDGQEGNEIFVGNDARPNHFIATRNHPWKDTASIQGVASGRFGLSNACMGIATGDFNRDGRFDMHVSNFFGEYDNLFLQTEAGTFRDVAPSYQLPALSSSNVGFGSKCLDVDRDGWLDLMTTNGHIFDQSHLGEPFRQPPLLMHNRMDRFEAVKVSDPSSYLAGSYLGRGLAKLDWNQDGQMDLVVTHLDRPAALLEVRTGTMGHVLQLEMVGVQSERDAIGVRVTIQAKRGIQVDWVTAGDGFLCTDEPVLEFGLADCDVVDEIQVTWPSGTVQTFEDVSADHRYLVVENESRLFTR